MDDEVQVAVRELGDACPSNDIAQAAMPGYLQLRLAKEEETDFVENGVAGCQCHHSRHKMRLWQTCSQIDPPLTHRRSQRRCSEMTDRHAVAFEADWAFVKLALRAEQDYPIS